MLATVESVLRWYMSNLVRSYSPIAAKERERIWGLFSKTYGVKELSDCCAANLLEFIQRQSGIASNHTRKRIRATVCRPFNEAANLGLIARNPFSGVKIPRGSRGGVWQLAEFIAALRHANSGFRRIMVFMRFSGCRPGEARAMSWGQIRVDKGLTYLPVLAVQELHKTSDLTDEPRRIHFNVVTSRLLAWLSARRAGKLVFVNSHGKAWTGSSLDRYFRLVKKRAGLKDDLKLHGLRHTFATCARRNGVDLKSVADLLGHRSVKTTEIYDHLIDDRAWMRDAANRAIGRNDSLPG